MGEPELKIFVGGLNQVTTKDSLNAYFAQFGNVDSIVMMDGGSGRSRGFGFVNFTDEGAMAAVLESSHEIDGMPVSCKPHAGGGKGGGGGKGAPKGGGGGGKSFGGGAPKGGGRPGPVDEGSQLKIFVGGLNQNTTKEMLDSYFTVFGVVDSYVMMDKETGRSRGFGFVNFKEEAALHSVLENTHLIDGVPVTCSAYSGGGGGKGGGYSEPAGRVSPWERGGNMNSQTSQRGALQASMQGASLKIFVGGLAPSVTKQDLGDYFSQWGQAHGIVMMDKDTGRSRGFGFVDFKQADAMHAVLDYHPHELHGMPITATQHQGGGGGGGGGGPTHSQGGGVVPGYKARQGGGGFTNDTRNAGGQGGGGGGVGRLGNSAEEILGNTLSLITQLAKGLQGTGSAGGAAAAQLAQLAATVGAQAAPPQQSRSGGAGGGGGGGAGAPGAGGGAGKLYVGNLSSSTTNESLQDAFSQLGPCHAEAAVDKQSNRCKGFGFVTYNSAESAQNALYTDFTVDGRQVQVTEYQDRGKGGGGGKGAARSGPY